jgi:hypothetical protein
MAGRTIDEIQQSLMAEPLREPGMFGRIAKRIHWLNEPFDNEYTLGGLFRKLTFQEPKEEGPSRLGRLTERVVFATLGITALALGTGGIGPILLFGAAKFTGVLAGELVQPVGRVAEGFFKMLDRKFGSSDTSKIAGASKTGEERVGASRHQKGMDMGPGQGMDQEMVERPVGASKFGSQTIKQHFGEQAADQRGSNGYRKPTLETHRPRRPSGHNANA